MFDSTVCTRPCAPASVERIFRIAESGLSVVSDETSEQRTVLYCKIARKNEFCQRCGAQGEARGTASRDINHFPCGSYPTVLRIRIPRWGCKTCGRVWRQNTEHIAKPCGKMTLKAAWYALKLVVVDHLSISAVARNLGVSWGAANDAVFELGLEMLINNPARLEGVRVIGVDEHVWSHTSKGPRFVTVIIDLTPVADKTGPTRLLDMVEDRSKKAFKSWLAKQTPEFCKNVKVASMDGFTGFKTAVNEELPQATTVMDSFYSGARAKPAPRRCRWRRRIATAPMCRRRHSTS
ncbi:hypothetical protein FYZ44_11315 [Mobiluncus mulieris]|nr:transposase [Mobiluncus mulieris]MCU9997416.1 hypothetical protein [Mobiluncus mulieris]